MTTWTETRATTSQEELFKYVYPALAGWVSRLVDDDETAHEIASEAFVRLMSRWTRVDSPRDYLYLTASRLIGDRRPGAEPRPRPRRRPRRYGETPWRSASAAISTRLFASSLVRMREM